MAVTRCRARPAAVLKDATLSSPSGQAVADAHDGVCERGRGDGDDFRAAGLPKFIVPRAPLVLDLAHRHARKPHDDCWWSTAAGAFLWGGYLNGVAAWGSLDPTQVRLRAGGRDVTVYAAVDQGCPFVSSSPG